MTGRPVILPCSQAGRTRKLPGFFRHKRDLGWLGRIESGAPIQGGLAVGDGFWPGRRMDRDWDSRARTGI